MNVGDKIKIQGTGEEVIANKDMVINHILAKHGMRFSDRIKIIEEMKKVKA